MDIRRTNPPLRGGDLIAERWVGEQHSYFPLFMDGYKQPRTQRVFTVREVLTRVLTMFKHLYPYLPAHKSPSRDYDFNGGRYVFSLAEDASPRGLVAVRLLPSADVEHIRYVITLLQFILPDNAPPGQYALHLYRLVTRGEIQEDTQSNFELFNRYHTNPEFIVLGINTLLSELFNRGDDTYSLVLAATTNLRNDRRVRAARSASRSIGQFLQIYQDSYVQLNYERQRANQLAPGLFFGTVASEMEQLLVTLPMIGHIADAANGRTVNRAGDLVPANRNIVASEPLATEFAALIRELESRLNDRFFLYAIGILQDDYGYNIDFMNNNNNNNSDDMASAESSNSEARALLKQRQSEAKQRHVQTMRAACRSGQIKMTLVTRMSDNAKQQYVLQRENHHREMDGGLPDDSSQQH